jgi:hypothetical protein
MPPLFQVLSTDAGVTALLGAGGNCRVYDAGEAPEGVTYPYATWQIISGSPENYLGDRPNIDQIRVQLDCWSSPKGGSLTNASNVADAIRYALESRGHQVDFGSTERDADTGSYRYRMDFDFWIPRG